ncbi:hypothetical protein SESBI_25247 [Sesbania bispinosa]|nr:hypothetical protein SESBI_25247 [Sesbania bispinosa]
MGDNLTAEEHMLPEKVEDGGLKEVEKKAGGSEQNESEKKLPYSPDQSQREHDEMFDQFMIMSKGLQISIPFLEALENIPNYAELIEDFLRQLHNRKNLQTV